MRKRSTPLTVRRLVALALVAAVPTALAQPRSVEFVELVKAVMVPVAEKPDPPSWNLGANPAIRWKSATPAPAAASLVKDGLPLAREGSAQVTVGGKVTHLRGRKEPGRWNVTLAGTSAYPMEFHLAMDSQADSGIAPAEELSAAGFKVKALCQPVHISSGKTVYAVEAPGYRAVVMSHEWSAGSGGTWMEVKLAYVKSRVAKMRCA